MWFFFLIYIYNEWKRRCQQRNEGDRNTSKTPSSRESEKNCSRSGVSCVTKLIYRSFTRWQIISHMHVSRVSDQITCTNRRSLIRLTDSVPSKVLLVPSLPAIPPLLLVVVVVIASWGHRSQSCRGPGSLLCRQEGTYQTSCDCQETLFYLIEYQARGQEESSVVRKFFGHLCSR